MLGRGIRSHLCGGAVGSGEAVDGDPAVGWTIVVVLTAVAGRRIVAVRGLLAVNDDRLLVVEDSH